MAINRKFIAVAGTVLGSTMSPLAIAGSPMVMVGPVGPAAAIPTLSNSLMIGLGVLLAIIALRALKQHGGALKVLCLAVFGGGLVVGGIGVERSIATSASVPSESSACEGGTASVATGRSPFDSSAQMTNGCASTTLQILGYSGLPCSAGEQIKVDGDVGDTMAPDQTVTLNSCPDDD